VPPSQLKAMMHETQSKSQCRSKKEIAWKVSLHKESEGLNLIKFSCEKKVSG
jgi:hypothetical protein